MTTDPGSPHIEVRGLRRTYGSGAEAFEAVRGVDLVVEPGTVVALLGTNGAGKTSALEVVEGLAPPTAGQVRVLGLDPVADRAEVRRRTGVLLQSSGFPADLTVGETLTMWAATMTAPRPVADALAELDLADRVDVRVRSLSGGELRRLDLACTLLGDPEVVLLDEPTTGLDPESRRRVWELVAGLRDRGRSVLLTTHHLEEAEELADRVAIMHAGRIVREGTPAQLGADHPSTIRFEGAAPAGLPDLAGLPAAARVSTEHGSTTIESHDLQATLTALLAAAADGGVRLAGLEARSASLESVFLAIASGADGADQSAPLEGAVR
ncbi:ABC transporter ATP-binding protein [Nocardioides marmotae]|uniref:ATP-binding cassette domain-containing protein n=1 Tax=Nocardioides marmotae TaxID=2663857 RepID=A0A6I3JE67_9ACTN|nr:ABC transporter ATP-binding protein [Nocardioides marmotae]MCR6032694.1 ATP-binding cassette domain-containing protein [Gordonia jinghuaiqii]MBC9732451.1 ABC transporter ATP-binding protein [Nocardioides marmotae]MTB83570.1 ATP-binding cassette domain-containing protein [Nocardioides marmotae]MTB96343.1 ATP-binding cassette domain-containing protein [Nocardioides marmotae]QKE03173.1 ABC transporter ATP-binding protein [Nocardioides marmotae]